MTMPINPEDLPLAYVTVRFPEPFKGERIAALVQQAVARMGYRRLVAKQRFYDGPALVLGTEGSGRGILVIPAEGLPVFSYYIPYSAIRVVSHEWRQTGARNAVSYRKVTPESAEEAVREFADSIRSMAGLAREQGDRFPAFTLPESHELR